EAAIGQQGLIEHRDVTDVLEPRRPRRGVVPGMRGRKHREARGQRLVQGGLIRTADVVMEDQERRAGPTRAQMEGRAGDGDRFVGPGCHRELPQNGRAVPVCERPSSIWWSNLTRWAEGC